MANSLPHAQALDLSRQKKQKLTPAMIFFRKLCA